MRTNNNLRNVHASSYYGFSMLELIAVVGIIGILAVAIIGLGEHMKKRAYATHVVQMLTSICTNAKSGFEDNSTGFVTPALADFEVGGKYSVALGDGQNNTIAGADIDGNTYSAFTYAVGNPATLLVTVQPNAKLGDDGVKVVLAKINANMSDAAGSATLWHTTNTTLASGYAGNLTAFNVVCNLN